jgi:hypothetical protein
MQTEKYRGYTLWGHAILQQEGILQPERFAGTQRLAGVVDEPFVEGRDARHQSAKIFLLANLIGAWADLRT